MMLHSLSQRMELFVIVLFLAAIGAQESQLEGPENTVIFVGSNVTLKCTSPSRNCNGIDWQKYVFGASPMTIFKGPRTILNVPGFDRNRYSVDNSNVNPTDAGRFICSAIISSSHITKTCQLIVLENRPNCSINASMNNTVEDDRVQLNCVLTYNGTQRISIAWKGTKDFPAAVKNGRTYYGTQRSCAITGLQNKRKKRRNVSQSSQSTTVAYNGTNRASTNVSQTVMVKAVTNQLNYVITPSETYKTLMSSTGMKDPTYAELNDKTIKLCQSYIVVASVPEVPSFTCIVSFAVVTTDHEATIQGLATNTPNVTCETPVVSVPYTTTANNSLLYTMMVVAVGILVLIILLIVCFCNETCPGYKFYNSYSGNKSKDELRDEQTRTENPDVIYSVVNKGQDIRSKVKSPNRPKGAPPPQPKAGNTDAFQHEEVTYADLAMEYGPRKVVPQNGQAAQEESLYAAVSVA